MQERTKLRPRQPWDVGAGPGPGVPAGDWKAGGNPSGPCVCLTPVSFFEFDEISFFIQTSNAATES